MNKLIGPSDDVDYEQELRQAYDCNEDGNDDGFINDILEATKDDRTTMALIETSLILDTIPVDEKRRVEIDKSLVIIGDTISSCDRIFTSPVPLVYTRHTSRFLTVWMICLPFGIYDEILKFEHATSGWPTIPVTAVLALFLFGIEELSIQLEEPFSILPLQKFCNEIKDTTKSIIDISYTSRIRRSQRKKKQKQEQEIEMVDEET